jgi:hypothetical protein
VQHKGSILIDLISAAITLIAIIGSGSLKRIGRPRNVLRRESRATATHEVGAHIAISRVEEVANRISSK